MQRGDYFLDSRSDLSMNKNSGWHWLFLQSVLNKAGHQPAMFSKVSSVEEMHPGKRHARHVHLRPTHPDAARVPCWHHRKGLRGVEASSNIAGQHGCRRRKYRPVKCPNKYAHFRHLFPKAYYWYCHLREVRTCQDTQKIP